MVWVVIILGIVLVIFLYNNGKKHTMVDPDVQRYNFAQTDTGEWVNFPTVFKLTGDDNIVIQTPDEKIVIIDVVEIEANKFTGTLDHLKVFTTVFMGDEIAYLHIRGNSIKNYKKLKDNTKVDAHESDRNNSLKRLANNYGCSPTEVKQKFIDEFTSIPGSTDQEEVALNLYRKEKLNEAKIFNINPNDTASAIMESWLMDYFKENKKSDKREIVLNAIQQTSMDRLLELAMLNSTLESEYSTSEKKFILDNTEHIVIAKFWQEINKLENEGFTNIIRSHDFLRITAEVFLTLSKY